MNLFSNEKWEGGTNCDFFLPSRKLLGSSFEVYPMNNIAVDVGSLYLLVAVKVTCYSKISCFVVDNIT